MDHASSRPTIKIEALVGRTTRPLDYGNTLMRQHIGDGRERLCVGISRNQDRYVLELASVLVGRCQILYVLHTTRTGAQLGRYESPELETGELEEVFREFGRFFNEDARHDVWLHSFDDDATIVLDRHNLIYAYGPIADFERVLVSAGVCRGTVPHVSDAHVHNYHPEWDEHEKAMLVRFPWHFSPLVEAEIQWP